MKNHAHSATSTPKYLTDTMLVPKYVTQFHCIGSDCPDTCCATWSINIDKDTFQKYRRVVLPTLKPLLQAFLVQVNKDSNARHGRMNLRPTDSRCGLHAPDGNCMVQQQLGEDALSDTCYVYPRYVSKFGDRFEQSLTLSCPEAARLALTQADAFDFVSAEFTTRTATTPVIGPIRGFSIEEMDEVRFYCVQLFQTESLSNTERLAAIGWLCQQLDALVASNSQATVETLLTEMTDLITNGNIHSIVGQLNKRQDASVTLFATLFGSKAPNTSTAMQREALAVIQKGLGIDAALDWELIGKNYTRGNVLLAETEPLYERLMGRYLLNDVVRETFPWSQPTAMGHYRRLLTRYGILRLMLSGRAAGQGKAVTESEMVQTIQMFCRFYQHNSAFSALADGLLADTNWTQLDHLYALLN